MQKQAKRVFSGNVRRYQKKAFDSMLIKNALDANVDIVSDSYSCF